MVAVLVMAKAPSAGAVKTRLAPLLGAAGCARLQRVLIRHTVAVAGQVAPGAVWVAVDPPAERAVVAGLAPETHLLGQTAGDLGERLAAASAAVLNRRMGPLLVIGTDIPTLTADLLTRAADLLETGRDVVFGPALDGGYYLVGLARPCPELFSLPPETWGGPDVLAESRTAAEAAGLSVGLLPELRDLDTPPDAAALLIDPALPDEIGVLLASGCSR
jgi:rSAM/selenodomain-associated transferase 1